MLIIVHCLRYKPILSRQHIFNVWKVGYTYGFRQLLVTVDPVLGRWHRV
jgi:hypothetical protein